MKHVMLIILCRYANDQYVLKNEKHFVMKPGAMVYNSFNLAHYQLGCTIDLE